MDYQAVESLEARQFLSAASYTVTNLISSAHGGASIHDVNSLNSWGLAYSATGPFWINNNGNGVAVHYQGAGFQGRFAIAIPSVSANTGGSPTGIVYNSSGGFAIRKNGVSAAARFIFVGEDGVISGWNAKVSSGSAIRATSVADAVYKGVSLGRSSKGLVLYAANFHSGQIDVFDRGFHRIHLDGSFTDANLPSGFAPFNVMTIGNRVFVTYAQQDMDGMDEVDGAGLGYIAEFDANGHFITHFASAGVLNAPWGMALAPSNFGKFSNDLLVGNFGDDRINAFNFKTGRYEGHLNDANNQPILIDDLWGLSFGNGDYAGPSNTLFFTAGPGGETEGLFGKIQIGTTPG